MDNTLTLFTPCYNGGKTIGRLFDAVNNQTIKPFEWIIINDGSTDNTDDEIDRLISQSKYRKIIYINNKQNKGKHRVWNEAVSIANGELFLPIDCDDTIKPTSIEFFLTKWSSLTPKEKYSGINVCCYDSKTGNVVGDFYASDGLETNNLELDYKYRLSGEHWGCIRTDILRKIPFPNIKSNYYSGIYLTYNIALRGYTLKCYNECLREYFVIEGSLSHISYKDFKYSRVFMDLHYNTWKVVHLTSYLKKNYPSELFKLYHRFFVSVVAYILFPFRKLL